MGHSYNHGMVTSMKGPAIEAFRVSAMNTSPCTIEEQCSAGVISAVTISSGLVTVQLVAPYPPKLVICQPTYTGTTTTTDIISARYVENSYNATTGQFQIALSNDDDSGAPAAASPAAADELHVLCIFKRYNNL